MVINDSLDDVELVTQMITKIQMQLRSLSEASYLLLTLAALFWAGNIVLARGVTDLIPPVSLAFWRWTGALLLVLPFTWRYVRQDWKAALHSWKIMLVLSILGIACYNTMLYKAVQTTTAINGALMQSSMPAVIILISLIGFRERISKLQLLGVMLSMSGAALIVLRGELKTLQTFAFVEGDLWMLAAVVLYAVYSVLLQKRPSIHPFSFLTLTFAVGSLCLLPLYIWEWSWVGPVNLNQDVLLSILYVAIFPSILAYLCWTRGIELIGANRTGLFINFIPLFASMLAISFLGETFHLFHAIGMALIFGGMVLFNRNSSRQ